MIKQAGTVLVVFYFALVCHAFFIFFASCIIPESLSKERQLLAQEKYDKAKAEVADETWLQTLKKYNILEPLWVLHPTGEGTSPALRKNLIVLAAIDTMMFGVAMGTMRVIMLYNIKVFHFDEVAASWYMSICNVSRVSCLLLLLPLLNRLFRGRGANIQHATHRGSDKLDLAIIRVSIIFDLAGYLGYALAPSAGFMVLSGVVASFGGIGSPTLQSSLTKHMPADRTGQILGAAGLLHALARVGAPTLFSVIFGFTVKFYAGFVFVCLASVFVFVFIISWFLKPHGTCLWFSSICLCTSCANMNSVFR